MLTGDRDPMLCERLNRHPHLRTRMESLLAVVEDAAGDCEKADMAERRVIDERRQMGHDALTAWAERGGGETSGVGPNGAGVAAGREKNFSL